MDYKWKTSALMKSASVEWGTPPNLYTELDKEFHFTLDPCQVGQLWDGCAISWEGHRVFCNPPYSGGKRNRIEKWFEKARESELSVFLLPSRTGTAWFHNYALKDGVEIRFFRGRLAFHKDHIEPTDHKTLCAPFDSLLVIFRNGKHD